MHWVVFNLTFNLDRRKQRVDLKYQSNFEKGLGLYDPQKILEDLKENLPDWVCRRCHQVFDFNESEDHKLRFV